MLRKKKLFFRDAGILQVSALYSCRPLFFQMLIIPDPYSSRSLFVQTPFSPILFFQILVFQIQSLIYSYNSSRFLFFQITFLLDSFSSRFLYFQIPLLPDPFPPDPFSSSPLFLQTPFSPDPFFSRPLFPDPYSFDPFKVYPVINDLKDIYPSSLENLKSISQTSQSIVNLNKQDFVKTFLFF